MSFYVFTQNNSGGSFDFDEKRGVTHHVIVEAADAYEANVMASRIGLYFDGVEEGCDCDCCGDRWYRADNNDGHDEPTVYGQPVDAFTKGAFKWMPDGKEICVHYLDGHMEWHGVRKAEGEEE